MITVDELIRRLEEMKNSQDVSGDMPVIVDCGSWLAEIEDIDLGGSDEGVIIWCGDRVEG